MTPLGLYAGETVSELGVLGVCLWRSSESGGDNQLDIRHFGGGWTFKTKPADQNEMSVVKGYGCFDTPSLVE